MLLDFAVIHLNRWSPTRILRAARGSVTSPRSWLTIKFTVGVILPAGRGLNYNEGDPEGALRQISVGRAQASTEIPANMNVATTQATAD